MILQEAIQSCHSVRCYIYKPLPEEIVKTLHRSGIGSHNSISIYLLEVNSSIKDNLL